MWGIPGAVIAVPVLVIVKVFCDHFPGLAVFGDFLAAESVAADDIGGGDAPPGPQAAG
jgi:predicted PurR-regulated permease PerM